MRSSRRSKSTGCVGADTGWAPRHLLLGRRRRARGAAPALREERIPGASSCSTSPGRRPTRGRASTTTRSSCRPCPFTPATGPRLLLAIDASRPRATRSLRALLDGGARTRLSSAFTSISPTRRRPATRSRRRGLLPREDCQFHWRNAAYRDFDDFLARFTRRQAQEAQPRAPPRRRGRRRFRTLPGEDVDSDAVRRRVRVLRSARSLQHGHEHYLNRGFFARIAAGDAGHRASSSSRAGRRRAGRRRDFPARRRHAVRPLLGRERRASTACTSSSATTRASSTASSTASQRSSPARRASTS